MKKLLLVIPGLVIAGPAAAHSVSARFGEIYSGMLHPVTTLLHLVPWIAMGLLAGCLGPKEARRALVGFPASVAAGALVAPMLPELPWVSFVNMCSFIALGALVVVSRGISSTLFWTCLVVFGVSHGYANNDALLVGWGLARYVLGLTIAAYVVITLVSAVSTQLLGQQVWGRVAIRAAGSWIVAIGVVFSGYTLMAL
ncbi:MAG: HupE/UreJ family protein [Pseudomonadota bacterium]